MPEFTVTVEQLVGSKDLHPQDFEEGPEEGEYPYKAENEDEALDKFHDEWGIKVLDDYEISVDRTKFSTNNTN